nr:hypothetical protein Iba_chr13cCG17080 [Ipomoea batatas]GME11070.1 hypothetical protein Iba_scaffold11336CG0010 [Ipomoea batatas]
MDMSFGKQLLVLATHRSRLLASTSNSSNSGNPPSTTSHTLPYKAFSSFSTLSFEVRRLEEEITGEKITAVKLHWSAADCCSSSLKPTRAEGGLMVVVAYCVEAGGQPAGAGRSGQWRRCWLLLRPTTARC